jgi:hypothetical protein
MTDRLLIFDPSTGEVSLSEHARNFSSFQSLEKADTTKVKNTFKAQLKVLFYTLSTDSPFLDRYTPGQRKEKTYKEIVPTYTPKKIETEEYKVCEKVLIRHGLSREEAQFLQIQTDFDKLLDHLNSIPWEKEITETSTQGKKVITKSYKISNMDERMKAIKGSQDILKLQKELESIVAGKKRSQDTGDTRVRLYEDPDYIPISHGIEN